MPPRLHPAVAALALALSAFAPAQTQLMVDAGRGPVLVRLPQSYVGQPVPLLVMLHAYLQTPAEHETFMGIAAEADLRGVATVHPIGLPDAFNVPHWYATTACCAWFAPGNDDSTYLRDLVDEVALHVNVAPNRIHATGYSNGAYMSYRLACDHADMFASVAPIGGMTWYDPSMCQPSTPLHVLHIHGTLDSWAQYNGGLEVGGNPYPSVDQTISYWSAYNGCATTQSFTSPALDLDELVPGAETARVHFETGCQPGGSVELWRMDNSNHFPVWTPNFAPLFIQWLLAHSKPGDWTNTGNDLAGTYGPPVLTPSGTANPGTVVSLKASNALENAAAVLAIGITAQNSPFAGGVLGPSLDFPIFGLVTNGLGELNLNLNWPPGLPIGANLYFQYWFQDAAGPAGLAATTTWQLLLP